MVTDEIEQVCSFESGCSRMVWDKGADFCIIHSPMKTKPGFWQVVLNDLNTGLREFYQDQTLNLATSELPTRETGPDFSIHFYEHWFPADRVPDWIFKCNLTIADSHFPGPLTVLTVALKRDVFFHKVTFHGSVYLHGCNIGATKTTILDCTFLDKVTVDDCIISDLEFIRGAFKGSVSFTDACVTNKLVFESLEFEDRLRLNHAWNPNSGHNKSVYFNDVVFSRTYFDHEHLSEYQFAGCQWERADGRFANRRIGGIREIVPRMQEEQFRLMRRRFSEEGHAELANEFRLSETEAQRNRMSPRKLEWWVLTAHKYVSFYNVRFLRPLFWLAILLVVLPFFHMYGGFSVVNGSRETVDAVDYGLSGSSPSGTERRVGSREWTHDWLQALNFSIRSMAVRFPSGYEPKGLPSRLAETAGMILGPSLALIFVFSLRRRFKVPSGLD